MRFVKPLLRAVVIISVTVAVVHGGIGASRGSAGGDERPLPPPVEVRKEPEGVTLEDPAFEPLPGARADFGRVGGSVYQIEVPRNWNGRLVLEMHGFGEFAPEARVAPPDIRRYLIGHGIAWAASSFSSTSLIPGRAADETAALWDYFARTYGRPTRSYITGYSMGGAATQVAAERYGGRYDAALALCGAAGQTHALKIGTDFFAAAAFAAGVTQTEFDATAGIFDLVRDRIRPALQDPQVHKRFEDLVIDLTGGPRPFAREGIHAEEETNWERSTMLVSASLARNQDRMYRLGPESTVTSEEFNRSVIRFRTNDEARQAFLEGSETTGNVQMPLLTLHSTGDGQVPIDQARIYRRKVEEAGKDDRVVQRVIADPGHCGFRTTEIEAAFEALMRWAERGDKPQGTDVLVDDLRDLDRTYELAPRPGTPAAADVRGAPRRVVLHGNVTVDGEPFDAEFLGAIVQRNGLTSPCQYTLPTVDRGRYEITVFADAEVRGCGANDAQVVLWTFAGDEKLYSSDALPWPGDGRKVRFDTTFSTSAPDGAAQPGVELAGEVYDRSGNHLRAGTRVEAYIGETRCGVGTVRRTGSFAGYLLMVARPESIPGCERGAGVTFRIDGRPAAETVANERGREDLTDLSLR
jgi:pimeloyl-ACP methyl ester carboxylesterase